MAPRVGNALSCLCAGIGRGASRRAEPAHPPRCVHGPPLVLFPLPRCLARLPVARLLGDTSRCAACLLHRGRSLPPLPTVIHPAARPLSVGAFAPSRPPSSRPPASRRAVAACHPAAAFCCPLPCLLFVRGLLFLPSVRRPCLACFPVARSVGDAGRNAGRTRFSPPSFLWPVLLPLS